MNAIAHRGNPAEPRPGDRPRARHSRRPARALPALSLGLLLALPLFTGCSRQTLVASATAPLITASVEEVFASGDIETVRRGLPGQILLLRGLCRSDPERIDTRTTAVQLYASYAMVFLGEEESEYALALYREGRDVGLEFLRSLEWFDDAWRAGPDALRAEIAERRPRELAPLMMWTAACLGQHILGHQDQPMEMLDLPFVHVLLDAAIELDGDYFYGMPRVIEGVMLATIPQGLGGNLELADRYFETARAQSQDRFLLHRVFYARHVCVAALDEERFVATLEGVLAAPLELPEVRFMNLIAKARAVELLARRAEFF